MWSLIVYMMEHGIAQHSGKQTGTTAAPDLLALFDLLSASYSYLPLPLAWPPFTNGMVVWYLVIEGILYEKRKDIFISVKTNWIQLCIIPGPSNALELHSLKTALCLVDNTLAVRWHFSKAISVQPMRCWLLFVPHMALHRPVQYPAKETTQQQQNRFRVRHTKTSVLQLILAKI